MSNEELLAKYKSLFPDNVEAIVVRKDDYDRLYEDLTIANIELKQEIERLKSLWETDKQSWNELMVEKEIEIERLNNIIKELEKYLIEQVERSYSNDYDNVLDKLDELKGSDKE